MGEFFSGSVQRHSEALVPQQIDQLSIKLAFAFVNTKSLLE